MHRHKKRSAFNAKPVMRQLTNTSFKKKKKSTLNSQVKKKKKTTHKELLQQHAEQIVLFQ